MNEATLEKADKLARNLFATEKLKFSRNVRELRVEIYDLLENGFTLEQIEAAARSPECRVWSYKSLVFLIKKHSVPVTSNGFVHPSYVTTDEPDRDVSPIDREATKRFLRQLRAELRV